MSEPQINDKILFGLKLRHYRLQKKFSFAELSQRTGMSVSYLNEIEKGKKSPKTDKITAIAQALELSTEKLTDNKVPNSLEPVVELLNSKFLNELPLNIFGVDRAKVVAMIAEAPLRVGAFISTLVDISKNIAQRGENFYFEALRSFLELNNNYFENLELETEEFTLKYNFDFKNTNENLERILKEQYGIKTIPNGLAKHPELKHLRSVYIPKKKTILLNEELNQDQITFQLGKELGFLYLNLKERAFTASLLQINSFEEVLNHFKAGYFSAALIMPREKFVEDLKTVFGKPKWEGQLLSDLMEKYHATPGMLFQRMTNLLPKYFGIKDIFFLRLVQLDETDQFKIDKELHLNRKNSLNYSYLNEHFCNRRLSVQILNDFKSMKDTGRYSGKLIGIQRSKFHDSGKTYLTFTIARNSHPSSNKRVSLSLNLLLDEHLKQVVKFWDDETFITKEVNLTCERCPIDTCEQRVIEPLHLKKKQKFQNTKESLAKLLK